MKQCPVCYSGNVKEYKQNGVPEIICRNCGYNSGDKNHPRHIRQNERDQIGKEKVR